MNSANGLLDDDFANALASELEGGASDKDVIAAVLLDTSGSMKSQTLDGGGSLRSRISGVNAGLQSLVSHCKSIPSLKRSVLLGVGQFGDKVSFDPFARVDAIKVGPMKAGGGTPMGTALRLALDAIQELVCQLDDQERRFSIPNLCIVSDGEPNRDAEFDAAVKRAAQLVKSGDLSLTLVGIDQSDCDRLKQLGLAGKCFSVAEISWEEVITQATLGGGGTSSQHDA